MVLGTLVLCNVVEMFAVERYVNVNNPTPAAPYVTWATAATSIQTAVNVASDGDVITVTNGVYQTGASQLFLGYGTNRVSISKALLVRSVNGPAVTLINGGGTMRCVTLVSNAVLSGFTLTNGGGAFAVAAGALGSTNNSRWATLTNCILTGNVSPTSSGGAGGCTLNNCILTNNLCSLAGGSQGGGGAGGCDLNHCLIAGNRSEYGGGVALCTLNDCIVTNNFAAYGGGAKNSVLNNCTIANNVAISVGGGAYADTDQFGMTNCFLIGNTVTNGNGGGVAYFKPYEFAIGALVNCALVNNRALGSGSRGGGVYGLLALYNCALTNNSATAGGGAHSGVLYDCILVGNHATNGLATGGGAEGGQLERCLVLGNSAKLGGGVYVANTEKCVFTGNLASVAGGGIYGAGTHNHGMITNNFAQDGGGLACESAYARLYSCLVSGNLATNRGGAVYGTGYGNHYLEFCTIAGNYAGNEGGGIGGETLDSYPGASYCIVSHNSAPLYPNYDTNFVYNYFTNDPAFVDPASGDYRLNSNSPCINFVYTSLPPDTNSVDLDGNPRLVGGAIDLGAYEFQSPASKISYFWLQQYGFPTDGSADHADTDGDHYDNWHEWVAHTSPLDATSLLKVLQVVPNGNSLTVTWQSVPGLGYRFGYVVERSTNLAGNPAFTFSSDIIYGSDTNVTDFVDYSATGPGPFFYRVRANWYQ